MKNLNIQITLMFIIVLGLLTGCAQPTPVVIFVTPTPAGTEDVSTGEPTQVPTVEREQEAASATPLPVTPSPTVMPGPTVTFMGPIVQEGYVPPPTNTLSPSATPEVQPTEPELTAAPTVVPADTDTPQPTRVGTTIPPLDTSDVGIQTISRLEQDGWNEVMKNVDDDLRLGWVKIQLNWDFFQPNGPNEISQELRRVEIFIEQIRLQRQVNVLISVAKAPDWARTDTAEDGPPNNPQQLADFITLFLTEFNGAVDAVEVWNEPNLVREWRGQPMNGAAYMRYFDAGYNAVRAFSPDIVVVSAGLAPTTNTEFSRDDRQFLREMYNAGLANYSNVAVGVHPYGWGNPPDAVCCAPDGERGWDDAPQFFFLNTIDDYRNIMMNYGHGGAQMWLTEFGWATWEGLPGEAPEVWMTYNDKWDQANYAFRAIEIGQSRDYIGPMFLWNLNFAQPILIENRDERAAYSIILPEGAPRERPLFWMLYDAVRPDEELDRYD